MVASPRAIGRMPDASGSRVPPWPAFCALNARLTSATALVEVMPTGLSRMTQPCTGLPFRLRAMTAFHSISEFQVLGDMRVDREELVDRVGIVKGGVQLEGEGRHMLECDPLADLAANELPAALQPRHHLIGLGAAKRHNEGDRVLEVGADRDLDHGHGDILEIGIPDLPAREYLGQRMADQLANAQLTLTRRFIRPHGSSLFQKL